MKRALGLVLAAAAACPAAATAAPDRSPVLYSLSVASKDSLAVQIRLRGDADGETRIDLPDRWAGTEELWRGLSGFSVTGGTLSGEGAVRTIRHRPRAPLVLRYVVASGPPGIEGGDKARPIVEPGWFFFHGEGVFATPAGREQAPVRFRWGAIPGGWKVASDLDHLMARPGKLADISESVGLGGADVTIVTRQVSGAPLRVAIRGKWDFAPGDLAKLVATIMAAEHALWRDPPEPFLVAMAPLPDEQGKISSTGTGRGDAFSILSTAGFGLAQATHLIAHEYMHHWVPSLLGGLPEDRPGREFWFSEGFDDYLTGAILLRGGLWSFEDYLADKNTVLARYAASSARAATGEEIAERFWKDENFEQISYDRGHLLALLIDARIRSASGGRLGLVDVLRAQSKAARPGGPTGAVLFPRALREVTGLDLSAEIARLTVAGQPFLLPPDAFGGCARLVVERRKEFTRGFDIDATAAADMSLRGVDPDGPAYAAGLRDGMRLIRRERGTIGDSAQEIAYRVADAGVERVIAYRPEGKKDFEVQQAVPILAGAAEQARCRILLGGGA
jgi:predicted metalloprotease with PDZ domain